MKRALVIAAAFALVAAPALADKAPPQKQIAHARVVLADIVDRCPEELASLDLGPAPAPGSTRLIAKADIEAALPEGAPRFKIPQAVRVARKIKSLTVKDLESTATSALGEIELGRGAKLSAVHPRATVGVAEGYDSVTASLPRPPRRSGKFSTTATLSFREGDVELSRIEVPIDLDLPKEATQPDVKKGSKVTFVLDRGVVQIKATGTAGADVDVGDALSVTIVDSGRALRGRLVQRDPAVVEEIP